MRPSLVVAAVRPAQGRADRRRWNQSMLTVVTVSSVIGSAA